MKNPLFCIVFLFLLMGRMKVVKIIKIGYQGEIGSNSEEAAQKFADENDMVDVEFVPLVESKYVIGELKKEKIDYAVVATRNSESGTVKETFEAIKDEYLELVTTIILPIHHCIFIKPEVDINKISVVISHIQALKQTHKRRSVLYPDWETKETSDTASAARNLFEGCFPDNYAVICRKNAGEMYGLKLINENIEDNQNNRTEFRVFKLPEIDYLNNSRPSIRNRIDYLFINEQIMSYIIKFIIIVAIVIAIIFSPKDNKGIFDIAFTIGGYSAALLFFITSNSFRQSKKHKLLEGYWKYYSLSKSAINIDNEQKFTTPRIVHITEMDGELQLSGVICDKENVPLFESKPGEVFFSTIGKKKGGLVYTYESPAVSTRTKIKGIAYLVWRVKYPASPINIMQGMYYGTETGDEGSITYLRITEKEYMAHKKSIFL